MRAIIFFLTFSIFVAGLVWRTEQVVSTDKMASYQSEIRAQVIGISKALNSEVKNLESIIQLSYNEIDRTKSDFPTGKPYSKFQYLSQVLPPVGAESKEWQIISQYYQEKSETKSWAGHYIPLALKSISLNELTTRGSAFIGLLDPQRKPYLLMIHNHGGNWYVGLLGEEIFQDTIEKLKGQKSSFFVVNQKGQAVAHMTREYIGSMLTEDPIVIDLMKRNLDAGNGEFTNLKREKVQGFYQRVEGTNSYVVTTTPMKVLTASKDSIRLQLGMMGVGMLLLGLAVFFISDKDSSKKNDPIKNGNLPNSSLPNVIKSPEVSQNQDRMQAYTQVASAISHELKPAVTSILGYSQLAMSGMPDESKPHVEKIMEEAREAREVLQKLLTFAGEDRLTVQTTSIDVIVAKALKNLEPKMLSKGIKIHRKIFEMDPRPLPFDLLVKAFEAIFLNAIEAMERAPQKELMVQVEKQNDEFLIKIIDSGEGIEKKNLEKVFDPFFTTRQSTQHVGLGLSTSLGIIKELSGEIHIDSKVGQGTTVTVKIPKENHLDSQVKGGAIGNLMSSSIPKSSTVTKTSPKALDAGVSTPRGAGQSGVASLDPDSTQPISLDEFKLRQTEIRPMDPLIVDTTIERLIEGDIPDMPPLPNHSFKLDIAKQLPSRPTKQESILVDEGSLDIDFLEGLIPNIGKMPEGKEELSSSSPHSTPLAQVSSEVDSNKNFSIEKSDKVLSKAEQVAQETEQFFKNQYQKFSEISVPQNDIEEDSFLLDNSKLPLSEVRAQAIGKIPSSNEVTLKAADNENAANLDQARKVDQAGNNESEDTITLAPVSHAMKVSKQDSPKFEKPRIDLKRKLMDDDKTITVNVRRPGENRKPGDT